MEAIIEVLGVAKRYSPRNAHHAQILTPTHLAIYQVTVVPLVGSVGAGQSVPLKILAGLVPPSAGEVQWHG